MVSVARFTGALILAALVAEWMTPQPFRDESTSFVAGGRASVGYPNWQWRGSSAPRRRLARRASVGGGPPISGSEPEPRMTLEEEFRTGTTLETEFARVVEARKKGVDIRREPGIEPKSDIEIAFNSFRRQATTFVGDLRFDSAPTVFWALLIGLIVAAWAIQLFRFDTGSLRSDSREGIAPQHFPTVG
eukprot:CAMPEP_0117525180 /NCGR_PEP_ID=MMETSP0784-20121206/35634_1 /TAXON_ID=39447 /ORGANISM="" /LENGTH=188 /DNA_ID=CAMNT_0005321363 /DNA_START=161 /DNA_END=724 /DNA_ORIENTATION=+